MLRFYIEVARTAFRRQLIYRWANLAGLLTNAFFGAVFSYVIIALYSARPVVAGYNVKDTLSYTWLVQAMIMVVLPFSWVGPDADHPYWRGCHGPEQALRLLLVLVQSRDWARRLLSALSRHTDIRYRDAALRRWPDERVALLAGLCSGVGVGRDVRDRLSLSV